MVNPGFADLGSQLLGAFVVALLGGVHCLGMCGGIVGALTLGLGPSRRPAMALVVGYNAGRITTYGALGALAGAMGAWGSEWLAVRHSQGILQGLTGAVMIALGLYLADLWRGLVWVERLGLHLWRPVAPWARRLLPLTTLPQALVAGMLWGFLPCGLVYSALIWALGAGGAREGGLLMLAFGAGTLPTVMGLGLAADRFRPWLRRVAVRRGAGAAVALLGVQQLWYAGYTLGG